MKAQGYTPLLASAQVARGVLHYKLESCHPSGSYKDRFTAVEIERVIAVGALACLATSSGNTGSSLAAACARVALRCFILVNADAPAGKLLQMQAHGATVIRIPAFTPEVFAILDRFHKSGRAQLVVSAYCHCPVGMKGVEQIAREIRGQLPGVKHVFVPVGGGGLYCAVARGFAGTGVRVHAVQPEGCPTLLNAARSRSTTVAPVAVTTRISGLAVPFNLDAELALALLRKNGGLAIGVTDEEVFTAQDVLLFGEGIYAEPAGAAALAGYLQAVKREWIGDEEPSVCLVTGHGFKDPASVERAAAHRPGLSLDLPELAVRMDEMLP
ncbi:MAG: PLP-dependent lyase/thiolase [Acidobacteria bacterium]|nr:PLP-dependent lyase/thiolase [Acidobacteriota bacterium]